MHIPSFVGLLLLALSGCAGDDAAPLDSDSGAPTTPSTSTPPAQMGPGAFAADFETSEQFFTLMAGPVDGASVHGTVQIWYSSNVRDLIEGGDSFVAPVGTVAIKVQDNGAESLTVMVKESPGFDPDNSDWSYEQRSLDGTVNNQGALSFCSDCHVDWAATDFLAGTELR